MAVHQLSYDTRGSQNDIEIEWNDVLRPGLLIAVRCIDRPNDQPAGNDREWPTRGGPTIADMSTPWLA